MKAIGAGLVLIFAELQRKPNRDVFSPRLGYSNPFPWLGYTPAPLYRLKPTTR